MYKNSQKLVQTRDNSMNGINKSGRDLSGLFKSSSALSKSLRQRCENLDETRDQTLKGSIISSRGNDSKVSRQAHTLSDSAKLVISMEKMEKPKNTKDLTIRNLSKFIVK